MSSLSCAALMNQSYLSLACFNCRMNLMSHHAIFLTTSLLLLVLLPSVSCLNRPLPSPPEGMPIEVDKFRLGSTPPSCHNRCHQCSPCTAVQVPTLPAPRKAYPSSRGDHSAYGNQFSNYKPLGWKCCCGGRLYNP